MNGKSGLRTEMEHRLANIQTQRLRSRIYQHHVPLFVACSIIVAVLYTTRPYKDVLTRLSFSTAYPALALLALTLLIGPWNLLRRKKNPVSGDFRRDVGIWVGVLGLIHVVVGAKRTPARTSLALLRLRTSGAWAFRLASRSVWLQQLHGSVRKFDPDCSAGDFERLVFAAAGNTAMEAAATFELPVFCSFRCACNRLSGDGESEGDLRGCGGLLHCDCISFSDCWIWAAKAQVFARNRLKLLIKPAVSSV